MPKGLRHALTWGFSVGFSIGRAIFYKGVLSVGKGGLGVTSKMARSSLPLALSLQNDTWNFNTAKKLEPGTSPG